MHHVITTPPDPDVVYLTNACGEDTGYGTIELTELDYKKVAFEDGPGYVLPYIVEINGVKCVMGVLEVACQDESWGEDNADYQTVAEAREYCRMACAYIAPRISGNTRLLPPEEGAPGRINVRVAVPLDELPNRRATKGTLRKAFGKLIFLPKRIPFGR